jgi:hypothetical protein
MSPGDWAAVAVAVAALIVSLAALPAHANKPALYKISGGLVALAVLIGVVDNLGLLEAGAGSGTPSPSTAPAPTTTPPPPTAPPTTPPTSLEPTDDGSKPIWHTGSLTFKSHTDPTDLDAPPSDKQWGRVPGIGSGVYELHDVYDGGLQFTGSTAHALLGQPGSYGACSATTEYASGGTQELARLSRGRTLCVQTDEGRAASMVVTAVSQESVTFDVTVWDN